MCCLIKKIQKECIEITKRGDFYSVTIKAIYSVDKISSLIPPICVYSSSSLDLEKIYKLYVQIPDNMNFTQVYSDFIHNEIKLEKDRAEDSRVNYESVIFHLHSLQSVFESTLSKVIKALSSKVFKGSVAYTKYMLTLKFLKLFKIYIDHLDSK